MARKMPVVQQKIKKKVVLMYVCRWWGQRSNKIYQIQFIKKSINVNKIKIQRNLRASRNGACGFVQVLTSRPTSALKSLILKGFSRTASAPARVAKFLILGDAVSMITGRFFVLSFDFKNLQISNPSVPINCVSKIYKTAGSTLRLSTCTPAG